MVTKNPPQMVSYKDGAFRTAIEKQIPIVPVTIPFNWIILPDPQLILHAGKVVRVVFHEPLETVGLTLADIPKLKERVNAVIDGELKKWNGKGKN
jgi:1-acyl-sn-glycerol-3-phosphate acyltransferase